MAALVGLVSGFLALGQAQGRGGGSVLRKQMVAWAGDTNVSGVVRVTVLDGTVLCVYFSICLMRAGIHGWPLKL